jgi:excisionase family DNA binding protein
MHVPRSTLYELVRARGLPHIRIGDRGLRFTRSDLEVWGVDHTYGTRRRPRARARDRANFQWGGKDSNLRPTDYESAALTS